MQYRGTAVQPKCDREVSIGIGLRCDLSRQHGVRQIAVLGGKRRETIEVTIARSAARACTLRATSHLIGEDETVTLTAITSA